MLFELEHPIIVTRRKRSASDPQYALVRARSPIHVRDYALSDVQTAAIMHHGNGSTTYRKIDGHFYKQMDYMPATALAAGSDMAEALIGRRTQFEFGAFMDRVRQAALELSDETLTLFKNVAYLDRPLTRQEQRQPSANSLLKAFAKAPELAGQLWLGREADTQKEEWATRYSDFLENVAIVDGVVHVRCFEPCLTMRLSPRSGTRYVGYSRLSYMEQHLGGGRSVDRRGVPYFGTGGDEEGVRYFSLNERERAGIIADELGCHEELTLDTVTKTCTIVDSDALSEDFMLEETYRVGVHALGLAHGIEENLASNFYSDHAGRKVLAARLDEITPHMAVLIDAVSPSTALDHDVIAKSTSDLVSSLRRDGENLSRENTGALAQLENSVAFLDVRRDTMPITVGAAPLSPFGT